MDFFLEKIVKRRKSMVDIAINSLIVTVSIIACIALFLYFPGLSPLLIAGVSYLAYFLISKRNIEFEYAVTNGDLDIDMIINQKKRKRVFSANCKDFEVVARVSSDKYTRDIQACKNVKDYCSYPKNPNAWFAYLRQGEPTVVLFEPNEQMIENFSIFIPRKVFKS